MAMIEDKIDDTKFYSEKAIAIATFFGGPLAAGVLIRRNFINLGREVYGKNALFIGIISTILLFVGLFSIPEHIIDKIPNVVIPTIYTGIIALIVNHYQGKELKKHKEKNGQFYSAWKAAGIGAGFMLIILAILFTYAFFSPAGFDTVKYDSGIAEFLKNEKKALELYSLPKKADNQQIIYFIKNTGIPAWKKNLEILNKLDSIEGLNKLLIHQNQIRREYCKLQIEKFQLIEKAVKEDTNSYDSKMEEINKKIEETLNRFNSH